MVYNTQNYWRFRFCLSSGILKSAAFQKLDAFPSSDEGVGDTHSVGSLRKSVREDINTWAVRTEISLNQLRGLRESRLTLRWVRKVLNSKLRPDSGYLWLF
jgi:hypothetical protein